MKLQSLWPWAAFAALLVLAWFVYRPGLSGDFLFDDFVNLPKIGASGPVDTWPTFWRYITSGTADPTGRPLALLSFLIDARNWPAAPWPFKRTNVLLHLFNGALLALFLSRLGRAAFCAEANSGHANLAQRSRFRIDLAAVLAAGIWLLHPVLVSTVLYIVQREAMLPATFVLLGLLAWLHGRARLRDGLRIAGTAWIVAGLGACTVLAVLSKGNGVLLPLLALTCEGLLRWRGNTFATGKSRRLYLVLLIFLMGLSALVVATLLLQQIPSLLAGTPAGARPWSVGQRALTEARVLWNYLYLLWLPRSYTPGLFNDQIIASKGWFAPWTTLPSVIGIAGLLIAAWILRKRLPFVACAVLFFFCGHLLESTVIPLELYFEHRNYLPSMLLFWPLSLWLTSEGRHGAWRVAAAITMLLVLSGTTWARTSVWGNGKEQAAIWLRLNPDSPRALANAIDYQSEAGDPHLAEARIEMALEKDPTELQYAIGLLEVRCRLSEVRSSDVMKAKFALNHTQSHSMMPLTWLAAKLDSGNYRVCKGLDLAVLDQLLDSMLRNPALTGSADHQREALHLKGRIALLEGDAAGAMRLFEQALRVDQKDGAALTQAAYLGSAGFPTKGLELLDYAASLQPSSPSLPPGMPRIHAWVLRKQHYWQNETSRLRATLAEDAAQRDAAVKGK